MHCHRSSLQSITVVGCNDVLFCGISCLVAVFLLSVPTCLRKSKNGKIERTKSEFSPLFLRKMFMCHTAWYKQSLHGAADKCVQKQWLMIRHIFVFSNKIKEDHVHSCCVTFLLLGKIKIVPSKKIISTKQVSLF